MPAPAPGRHRARPSSPFAPVAIAVGETVHLTRLTRRVVARGRPPTTSLFLVSGAAAGVVGALAGGVAPAAADPEPRRGDSVPVLLDWARRFEGEEAARREGARPGGVGGSAVEAVEPGARGAEAREPEASESEAPESEVEESEVPESQVPASELPASEAEEPKASPREPAPEEGGAKEVSPRPRPQPSVPAPPKADPPKADPPKVAPPKAGPPKADPPKAAPKAAPPKATPPKADPRKADPRKAAPPKAARPKAAPALTTSKATKPKANSSRRISATLAVAAGLSGIPYRWGGTTTSGFDCSGFTQHVFRKVGVNLPRTAAQQQRAVRTVTEPRPGDLVFFGAPAHHVGIYAGDGRMYDSPRTGRTTGLHRIWSSRVSYGRAA